MSKLKKNLKIIFMETTTSSHLEESKAHSRRFIAKSLDGGTGWGVWDKQTARFLKDREVVALTADQCRAPFAN